MTPCPLCPSPLESVSVSSGAGPRRSPVGRPHRAPRGSPRAGPAPHPPHGCCVGGAARSLGAPSWPAPSLPVSASGCYLGRLLSGLRAEPRADLPVPQPVPGPVLPLAGPSWPRGPLGQPGKVLTGRAPHMEAQACLSFSGSRSAGCGSSFIVSQGAGREGLPGSALTLPCPRLRPHGGRAAERLHGSLSPTACSACSTRGDLLLGLKGL